MTVIVPHKEHGNPGPKGSVHPKGHPRPGLHARLRRVSDLTPHTVLRQPFHLPVVIGSDFTTEEEALWEEFDTVSSGRYAQAAAGEHGEALQTVSVEALTMTWDPGWLTEPHVNPKEVLNTLRRILRKRAVFDLLVVQKPNNFFGAEFSGYASLRRLSITARRGEPDTRYLQMDISSHRRMSARRRRHGKASNLPTTVELDKNDTLRSLAGHFYGSGEYWRLIANANGISNWGSETPLVQMNRYKPGDRIKIPERPHRTPPNGGTTFPDGFVVAEAI